MRRLVQLGTVDIAFVGAYAVPGERERCLHLSWEEGVRCSLERPLARLVGGLDVI